MFTYSFTWAEAQLKGRSQRKLTHNTYLGVRSPDTIAVRLHNTDVITYHRNGNVMLDSGGWQTVTTKDRMNRYTDARISSTKGVWDVYWGSTTYGFADGMVLHPDGTASGFGDLAIAVKGNAERNAAIRKYLAGITPERIVSAWANPGGDCLYCQMGTADSTVPTDCAAVHVAEDYFMASLSYRAIAAKGYPNPQLMMEMILMDAKRGHVDRTLTDSLRRYLKNALTAAAVSA